MTAVTVEQAHASAGSAIAVRSDLPAADLDRYVHGHAAATGYHLSGWRGVVERAFGHETRCLAAVSPDGRIAGVLPLVFFNSRLFGRFTVSMPFLNYGGVVAGTAEAARALVDGAIAETTARRGSHLELRHTEQLFTDLVPKRHKVAMRLRLAPDAEKQWEALDRKVRNQVRKGEKSQLAVVHGGAELVREFYSVFAHNMRDLGTPVYARAFFDEVLRTFADTARVFVARHEGRPVAASIVYWHRSMIEVPWASALRASNPLSANVLLYWHMLKFAVERGFTVFDFGRSTPNEGTFHFKRQWGAEPLPLVWEYWNAGGTRPPDLNPKNPKFDLAIRVWQRLPVPVATALGPHVVRNIP
jgi:FemAB-related protein (PEP-CTERM system-associated)